MSRRDAHSDEPATGLMAQRVDKWLWHARVVKTRTLAAEIVEAGKVRRNRERLTKSSDQVKLGDVLTITLPSRVIVLRTTGFSDHRGSPQEVARLFEDVGTKAVLAGFK